MDPTKIWTKENANFTKRILLKMEDDPHLPDIFDFINKEVANIWVVLAYLAKITKPDLYAELGVRKGFSMAIVGARRKRAALVGFDNWTAGYGGASNPGPDFVKSELQKVGHQGPVEFISGDNAVTVPAYEPAAPFPLILADAEHTYDGVLRDIHNCLPMLAPGGYLVIDDLQDAEVMRAWQAAISEIDMWTWQQDRVGIIRNG